MKKLVLFTAAMLIGLTSATVSAEANHGEKDYNITKRYRYAQPIMFVESGVEFLVFPDGSFDFTDLNLRNQRQRINDRRRFNARQLRSVPGGRNNVRFVNRTPRTQIFYNRFGDISMINGIYIDYDRQGKVRQIGSVDMGYQRGQERLRYVGNLRVNYNRWGEIVHLRGHVNRFNTQYNSYLGQVDYFDCDDYDDDYYYYKKEGKRQKHKKRKRIKR